MVYANQPTGPVTLAAQWSDAYVALPGVYGLDGLNNETYGYVQSDPSTEERISSLGARVIAQNGGSNDDRFARLGTYDTARAADLTTLLVFDWLDTGHGQVSLDRGLVHMHETNGDGRCELGYWGNNGYNYTFRTTSTDFSRTNRIGKRTVTVVSTDVTERVMSVACSLDGTPYAMEHARGIASYISQGSEPLARTDPYLGTGSFPNFYHPNGYVVLWAQQYRYADQAELDSLVLNPWQIFDAAPARRRSPLLMAPW